MVKAFSGAGDFVAMLPNCLMDAVQSPVNFSVLVA